MLAVVAAAGCKSPVDISAVAAAYRDAVERENRRPTIASAVERAVKLLSSEGLPHEVCEEFGRNWGPAESLPQRPSKPLLNALEQAVRRNKAAFQVVREARGLPPGLLSLDLVDTANDMGVYLKLSAQIKLLHSRLCEAALLHCWKGSAREGWEYVRDAITVEAALTHTPVLLAHYNRTTMQGGSSSTALRVAQGCLAAPDTLREMAEVLTQSDVDVPAAMRTVLPFQRAARLMWLEKLARGDAVEMDRLIKVCRMMGENWPEMEKTVGGPPTAEFIIKRLPADRAAIESAFAAYEANLKRADPKLPRTDDTGLGYAGHCAHPNFGRHADALLSSVARPRCAVALLRVLAFKTKKGRMPNPGEVRLPENPFAPESRVKVVLDSATHRLGAHIRWPGGDEEDRIGYWLQLPVTGADN